MKSFRTQPIPTLPGRNKEIRLLKKICRKIGLSEAQELHLLSRVFFDENALNYWVQMHQENAFRAEQYLIRMAPPQTAESKSIFDLWWLKWLTPLARALGLIA